MHALPLIDTIVVGTNTIKVNGKDLDVEQTISFRESCLALKDNFAKKIIDGQIRYLATNLGVYKSTNIDELYFYKSALWNLSQVDAILDKIV